MKLFKQFLSWCFKIYFTYIPKGKKEIMYQTALQNIETKEVARKQIRKEALQMLDKLREKCARRGYHRYSIPSPGESKAPKCKDCLFEHPNSPYSNKKLSQQLQGTGVEMAKVE